MRLTHANVLPRLRSIAARLRTVNAAAAVRALAIAAALAAPFLPPAHRAAAGRSVVYVVDRSASVGRADRDAAAAFVADAARQRGDASIGVVSFAAEPEVVAPVGGTFEAGMLAAADQGAARRGSDLAGAVRLAAAALPEHGERRVVILSDGRGTRGDAEAEVARVHEAGVAIDTVPLGAAEHEAPTVGGVRLEHARVSEGEPVTGEAQLLGRPGGSVRVTWTRDDGALETQTVALDGEGRGLARLHDPAPAAGNHVYEARVVDGSDGQTTDVAGALAIVSGRPRVMVLSSTGERPALLLDALSRAEAQVVDRNLEAGQPTSQELAEVDLVVLADVAIARRGEVTLMAGLNDEGQATLIEYVSERGGGLIALGGLFGFGPEYSGQPITRVLPVEVEDFGELENPSVAMAIMLDRSGSMTAMVGQHTKLELAIEAALAAAGTLRTYDRVAIGSVDEMVNWVQPLGSLGSLMARREYIRSMGPGGGGIFVYTALTEAYASLQRSEEPVRHVVLFADTSDSEEQFQGCVYPPCGHAGQSAVDLAATARASGITTSVVGIGSPGDCDVRFQRNLAAAGGGRFYITSQATDLRRIFVSETRAATRSSLREDTIELEPLDPHQILDGVDLSTMPTIEGFVQTGRRTTAETALVTPDGRPVLATWRYGLGTVVAWTTDGGQRWTSSWSSWGGAGQMMRQMVRFAMRRRGGHGVEARVDLRDGAYEIAVEAPEGSERGPQPARVAVSTIAADGSRGEATIELEREAPGRWAARGEVVAPRFAVARVLAENGQVLAEAVGAQDGEAELAGVGPDERALREMARVGGGVYAPEPAGTLRSIGARDLEPVPTWPLALCLAALLVCADLWLRRLGQGRKLPALVARAVADRSRELDRGLAEARDGVRASPGDDVARDPAPRTSAAAGLQPPASSL